MAELKKCSKCNRVLSLDSFSKRKLEDSTGHYGQCKSCIAERKAEWKRLHPDYFKEYHEEHKVLKPLITKVCPYCCKSFKTNNPNQIHCTGNCRPMTPIRRLKLYLKAHPEIDKVSFFKARYKDRHKEKVRFI